MTGAWRSRSACLGADPELFYPELDDEGRPVGGDNHGREGKAICESCPVRLPCLVDALTTGEKIGIRGGHSLETARRWLLRPLATCPHDPTRLPEVCGCSWCRKVAPPSATVADRNGPGATHGLRVTYNRGCRCAPCTWSATPDAQRLAAAGIGTPDWWAAHGPGAGSSADVLVALRHGWVPDFASDDPDMNPLTVPLGETA